MSRRRGTSGRGSGSRVDAPLTLGPGYDGSAGAAPGAFARPPAVDLALLVVAVAGVSTSGPIIRAAGLPSLSVAFWRNALAAIVLGAWILLRKPWRDELRALDGPQRRTIALSGVLLALHFAVWIPSLSFTSVASSTALAATQPIWSALIARLFGLQIPRQVWIGITVAMCGVFLVSGSDWQLSSRAFGGDVLACMGGMLAAAYVSVGARSRRTVGATVYAFGCYSAAAATLLLIAVGSSAPLRGYGSGGWTYIVVLTVTAQLGGHAIFSRVLRTTGATTVSVAVLFEIVGSSMLAWAWLHERPSWILLPAAALIMSGVAVVVTAGRPAFNRHEGLTPP